MVIPAHFYSKNSMDIFNINIYQLQKLQQCHDLLHNCVTLPIFHLLHRSLELPLDISCTQTDLRLFAEKGYSFHADDKEQCNAQKIFYIIYLMQVHILFIYKFQNSLDEKFKTP